jgi:hypothetical protein
MEKPIPSQEFSYDSLSKASKTKEVRRSLIQKSFRDGLESVTIENNYLKATFLPEVGGKMIRLMNVKTGNEFLLESQLVDRSYQRAYYGAEFAKFDVSGFDDCFPTIAASPYRSLSRADILHDIGFPDHGELWSRPWEYNFDGKEISFSIEGVKANYRFERKARVEENKLILSYALTNLSNEPFSYLWSAHPLLKIHVGDRLILPRSVTRVLLDWVSDEKIGKHGDIAPWPFLSCTNKEMNYAEVQDKTVAFALKCFTERLSEGYAGLYNKEIDQSVVFEFDVAENPYLGVWLCYGGWPADTAEKHYTVALEPCNGRPDSLSEAVLRKECAEVDPGDTRKWGLTLSVRSGMPN